MVSICDKSICKPLGSILRLCLQDGKLPSEWKKTIWFMSSKSNKKQEIENYRIISLLAVSSKIFERLLYHSVLNIFTENTLLSQIQSGFKSCDSCTKQLWSITHQIYRSFNNVPEIQSVFLDTSKAFDKLWHMGFILKLEQTGISGNFLSNLTDFLNLRKQSVVLNDQLLSSCNTESSVSQGFILGSLLFFIYINDLSESLTTNVRLFADDFSL